MDFVRVAVEEAWTVKTFGEATRIPFLDSKYTP
jgi:hypothetical protein